MKNRSTADKKKRVRPEVKQEPLISSLSETQQIAMGFRNPRVVTPNFAKTEEERKKWKEVHTNARFINSGSASSGTKRSEPIFNLILHTRVEASDSNGKTTHTFKARESEIGYIMNNLLDRKRITKGWYAGRELAV